MPLLCQKCAQNSDWDNSLDSLCSISVAQDAPSIASHRAALTEIENEIVRFKAYSAQYISTLVRRQNDVKALREMVTYPVLSLPTELMSRIFIACLPSDGEVRPSIRRAPLLLMRVCRLWRDIALSTCQLWSSLDIGCINTRLLIMPGMHSGLEGWLSRAHTLPLSLKIHKRHKSPQIVDDSNLEPLEISPHLPQVERLVINLPAEECRRLIRIAPLNQLRSLTASLSDADVEQLLKNAPVLAELYWMRSLGGALDSPTFASNTLTKLDICSSMAFSPDQFIGILQHLPLLSYLACCVATWDIHTYTPLSFPNLRTLCLRRDVTDSFLPINALALVTLPNLCELDYILSPNRAVILPFLSRSECVIRGLEIVLDINSTTTVRRQLEPFPSVEELGVSIKANIATLINVLCPLRDQSSPPMLPNLRRIKLIYDHNMYMEHPIDYCPVIDLAHRRRAGNATGFAKLESLHIAIETKTKWDWYPNATIAAELRRLIASGLDFGIRAPNGVWPNLK